MEGNRLRAWVFFAVTVIFVAYMYKRKIDNDSKDKLDQVLTGLLRAERKVGVDSTTKIALGFGGCEDIFVDAIPFLERMKYDVPDKPEHLHDIANDTDVTKMFAYFFRHGAAAERYVKNATLFSSLTKVAAKTPGARFALGGNAPAMARRLAMEGANILLASRFTKKTMKTLPDSIKVLGKPLTENDIHLIMEYSAGSQWGNYTANRANRFIVHSDKSNPYLETLEDLEREMDVFDPSVLVVGGLQMMDNFPFKEGVRQERLGKLKNFLSGVDRSTKIHFELASFSDETLMKEIVDSVVMYSDSLGMNEQELPNLVSIITEGTVSLVADSYPRIATVLDQMRTVYSLLKNTNENGGKRKLTRLHVHTLAYQAILTTKGSSWKNTMSAAAKASLTANRHVCGSNYIDVMKAKLIMDDSFSTTAADGASKIPLQEQRPVSCWQEEEYDICLAPVLVCTEVLQTGGGGDNISSAGLLYQV